MDVARLTLLCDIQICYPQPEPQIWLAGMQNPITKVTDFGFPMEAQPISAGEGYCGLLRCIGSAHGVNVTGRSSVVA